MYFPFYLSNTNISSQRLPLRRWDNWFLQMFQNGQTLENWAFFQLEKKWKNKKSVKRMLSVGSLSVERQSMTNSQELQGLDCNIL